MVTKEQAVALRHGSTLHHVSEVNADGTPLRVRVNGKCQVWKTRPTEFRLPCKYGLKQGVQVTHDTAHQWEVA